MIQTYAQIGDVLLVWSTLFFPIRVSLRRVWTGIIKDENQKPWTYPPNIIWPLPAFCFLQPILGRTHLDRWPNPVWPDMFFNLGLSMSLVGLVCLPFNRYIYILVYIPYNKTKTVQNDPKLSKTIQKPLNMTYPKKSKGWGKRRENLLPPWCQNEDIVQIPTPHDGPKAAKQC